jgi:hypothetical protein
MKTLLFTLIILNTTFAIGVGSAPSPSKRAGVRLFLFSNPTNKDITIEYTKGEDNEPAELVVYNQIGELILVKTLTDNKTEVNLSNLSSGIYLYTIKQQGLILKTNKLVITK